MANNNNKADTLNHEQTHCAQNVVSALRGIDSSIADGNGFHARCGVHLVERALLEAKLAGVPMARLAVYRAELNDLRAQASRL